MISNIIKDKYHLPPQELLFRYMFFLKREYFDSGLTGTRSLPWANDSRYLIVLGCFVARVYFIEA